MQTVKKQDCIRVLHQLLEGMVDGAIYRRGPRAQVQNVQFGANGSNSILARRKKYIDMTKISHPSRDVLTTFRTT